MKSRKLALIEETILRAAADQLVKDRGAIEGLNRPKPGLAEYLDLLYALKALFEHEGGCRRAHASSRRTGSPACPPTATSSTR